MKHYFVPRPGEDWSTIPVYAPVAGTVYHIRQEWAGIQIEMTVDSHPKFAVVLFHVNPSIPIDVGTRLEAGQRIGSHIGTMTWSDVTIRVDSTQGMRLVSFFDALTDDRFAAYAARGLTSRQDAIISRGERDAQPLSCNGEAFLGPGTIENWTGFR